MLETPKNLRFDRSVAEEQSMQRNLQPFPALPSQPHCPFADYASDYACHFFAKPGCLIPKFSQRDARVLWRASRVSAKAEGSWFEAVDHLNATVILAVIHVFGKHLGAVALFVCSDDGRVPIRELVACFDC